MGADPMRQERELSHRIPPNNRLEPFAGSINKRCITFSSSSCCSGAARAELKLSSPRHYPTRRYGVYEKWLGDIEKYEGGLDKFSLGYKDMGFQVKSDGTIVYKEWAPAAQTANLIGEFSQSRLYLTAQLQQLLDSYVCACFCRQLESRIASDEEEPVRRMGDYPSRQGRPACNPAQHESQGKLEEYMVDRRLL